MSSSDQFGAHSFSVRFEARAPIPDSLLSLLAIKRAETLRGFWSRVPASVRREYGVQLRRIFSGASRLQLLLPVVGDDAQQRDILIRGSVRDRVITGIVADVTPELRHLKDRALNAERRADQAILELNHRVRNIMSVVTALISLSARYAEDVDAFSVATISRINALNIAYSNSGIDPLRPETIRQTVCMMTLANGILGENPLVTVCKEPLELSPGQASAMGLIIHELASNAHEHGAFTKGHPAELCWWRNGAHFGIEWIEPTDAEDADLVDGFGMTIVKHLTRSYLNGACAWKISGGKLHVSVTGIGGGEARASATTIPR